MIIKTNEPLNKYTTFRMGGLAEKMYFPESVDDICSLRNDHPEAFSYIIGGGSNLLINDSHSFAHVLCLREFNKVTNHKGDGVFYFGAAVRLQTAIKEINSAAYGGIEYLFSVPGLIGGAICMNAGRGKSHNKCISDYIESVDVYVDGEIKKYNRDQCQFSYRSSIFQAMPGCIIIGATFKFPQMSEEESSKLIAERKELCKQVQDMSFPNFGTVFCESNKYIMEIVKRIQIGKKGGCHFFWQDEELDFA